MIEAIPAERSKPAKRGASATRLGTRPVWLADAAGLAVCVLAALLALVPLAAPGMVATHDGLLHVQRLIALDDAARQDVWMPRWLPDLAYGYGEPVLLYYAPLAYLPALAARLLGVGYVGSVEAAGGIALVLSAVAMYVLARSLTGGLAATVAGVVYALLPYQLVDLYVRGTLAESWAFVWLPLASWCLIGARRDGRARWSVGLAVTLAGLILTHNVTALLFLPALVGLALLLWLLPMPDSRNSWLRPALGLLAALGLSAWFWLPALAERGLVQIGETLEPDLFASLFFRTSLPFRLDLLYDYREPVSTALGSPIFWPQLGLVQVVITLAGALALRWARGIPRSVGVWAVALIVGGIVLQVGPAARLYDVVPLLAFVQFPWRLLALVGLGSALLAGLLIDAVVGRPALRMALAALVIGATVVTGLARLQPEQSAVGQRQLSRETILRAELADYGLGTTHSGEYLPITSGQRNAARFRKTLLDDPDETPVAPSAIEVRQLDWRADRIRAEVQASAPDRLVVHQFAFPGWTATVDGAPATIRPAEPFGLLAVDAPAGSHVVEFTWGQTPLRLAALAISLVTLVLLPALAGARGRSLVVGIVGFAAIAAIIAFAAVLPLPDIRPVPRETPHFQPSDGRLALVGSRLDTSRLDADHIIVGDLAWLVRQAAPTGYRATLDVVAADGTTHATTWPYETLSRHWQRGELVRTPLSIRLPGAFPAGPAEVRLRVAGPEGEASFELGAVTIPTTSAEPAAGTPVNVGQGLTVTPGAVRVAGWTRPSTARPGDALDADLAWRSASAAPDLDHEYLTVLALQAPAGDVTSEATRPGDWFAPLPFWQPGEEVVQRVRVVLPPGLQAGSYPLTARIYARDLARGGLVAPGAATLRVRGRPLAEVPLGSVTVAP